MKQSDPINLKNMCKTWSVMFIKDPSFISTTKVFVSYTTAWAWKLSVREAPALIKDILDETMSSQHLDVKDTQDLCSVRLILQVLTARPTSCSIHATGLYQLLEEI